MTSLSCHRGVLSAFFLCLRGRGEPPSSSLPLSARGARAFASASQVKICKTDLRIPRYAPLSICSSFFQVCAVLLRLRIKISSSTCIEGLDGAIDELAAGCWLEDASFAEVFGFGFGLGRGRGLLAAGSDISKRIYFVNYNNLSVYFSTTYLEIERSTELEFKMNVFDASVATAWDIDPDGKRALILPSMFKKKSKPVATPRTRDTSPENGTTQAEESPSTLATKLKKAKRKPKARLSFGGDDEVCVLMLYMLMILVGRGR